jgi:hypothetical protein
MADSVKSEYDRIKATETLEFWKLFQMWREKIERERQSLQSRKK